MKQFVLIIFLLIFGITKGQSSSKLSRNFWLGHGVSFKVFKKTEMSFQAEQRFGVNNFEIEKNLIELGLKRKYLSYLNLDYYTGQRGKMERIIAYVDMRGIISSIL